MEITLSVDPDRRYIHIAACPSMGTEYRASQHGVVDSLARKLIEAGADPNEMAIVTRDDKRISKTTWPLSKWARLRLTENDDEGFKWRRYEKPPEFADRSNHTARFEPSGVSTYPPGKEAAE